MSNYTVRSKVQKETVLLPGSDTYFVEFREFSRVGRDDYARDRLVGGHELIDTMLRYGISDFLLPGEHGDVRYTGTDVDWVAYNNLGEDLEDFMVSGVARINRLRKADGTLACPTEDGDEVDPGNCGGSQGEPCEAVPPATCETAAPARPPS
jgi:hypothetical protein